MASITTLPETLQSIRHTPLFVLELDITAVQRIGDSVVGVVGGGKFAGARINGRVLPGGSDWQRVLPDGTVRLDCRIVLERYSALYAQILADAPNDRIARFEAIVEFNLQDTQRSETKRYFIQLWAMLMSLDEGKGAFLNELYHIDIEALCERIAELDVNATAIERRRRATILAAMIEGLTVVSGAHGGKREEREALMRLAKRVGLQIATGTIAS